MQSRRPQGYRLGFDPYCPYCGGVRHRKTWKGFTQNGVLLLVDVIQCDTCGYWEDVREGDTPEEFAH